MAAWGTSPSNGGNRGCCCCGCCRAAAAAAAAAGAGGCRHSRRPPPTLPPLLPHARAPCGPQPPQRAAAAVTAAAAAMAPTAGAFVGLPFLPRPAGRACGGPCIGGVGNGRGCGPTHRCFPHHLGVPPIATSRRLPTRHIGCVSVQASGSGHSDGGSDRQGAGGRQPSSASPVATAAASSSSAAAGSSPEVESSVTAPAAVPAVPAMTSSVPAPVPAPAASAVVQAAEAASTDGALAALAAGTWVKLICGASSTDAPRVRNTALVYTVAGVHCIDVAADGAVVAAAWDGISAGLCVAAAAATAAATSATTAAASTAAIDAAAGQHGDTPRATRMAAAETETEAATTAIPPPLQQRPLLMISVNDDEDPHFRKAVFDPALCPPDCPRPCAVVCPASAIAPRATAGGGGGGGWEGVFAPRCYGCGRCEPVCPLGLITTPGYVSPVAAVRALLAGGVGEVGGAGAGAQVDAIEIHTRPGHEAAFRTLWDELGDTVRSHQRVVAVSLPDHGGEDANRARLAKTYAVLAGDSIGGGGGSSGDAQARRPIPQPTRAGASPGTPPAERPPLYLIWQTDGRPMSGDLGRGTARASVALGRRVRAALEDEQLPGYVQLAGGTNAHTATLLGEAAAATAAEAAEAAAAVERSAPPRGGCGHGSGGGGDGGGSGGGLAGVAYGGYARKLLAPFLEELDARGVARLEECPDLLGRAVAAAMELLAPIKGGVAARVGRP